MFIAFLFIVSLKAKLLFKKMCPEDDFMPSPPDPEDIIFEEEVAREVGEAEERDGADKSEVDKAPGSDAVQDDQTLDKEETEPVKEVVNDTWYKIILKIELFSWTRPFPQEGAYRLSAPSAGRI